MCIRVLYFHEFNFHCLSNWRKIFCRLSDDRVPQMPDVGPLVLCQDKERPSTRHLHMPKMSAISGQEHSGQEHSGQTERREDKRPQLILAFTSIFRPDSHLLISLFLFHCFVLFTPLLDTSNYCPPSIVLPVCTCLIPMYQFSWSIHQWIKFSTSIANGIRSMFWSATTGNTSS